MGVNDGDQCQGQWRGVNGDNGAGGSVGRSDLLSGVFMAQSSLRKLFKPINTEKNNVNGSSYIQCES